MLCCYIPHGKWIDIVQFAAHGERKNQLRMNHRLVVGRARATALRPRRARFRNLACVAVVLPVLAAPATAGALTLTGSGSMLPMRTQWTLQEILLPAILSFCRNT